MKLIAEIVDKHANREFRRFLEVTGTENWERKIAKLHSLPRFRSPGPNVYSHYLASRNPSRGSYSKILIFGKRGKSLRKNATPALMKASGHLKVINAVIHQGGTTAVQKVRSVVLDDETVRSFL